MKMPRTLCTSLVALAACSAAQAQYASNFENPPYNASAAGTLLAGQDGWYNPVVGSTEFNAHTYAGNVYGIVANPLGSAQMIAGRFAGLAAFARAQHANNFAAGGVWTMSWDCLGMYNGVLPTVDNLGSFSMQPSGTVRYWQSLMQWGAANLATATQYNLNYGVFDTAPYNQTAPTALSPGAAWQNVPVNHWIRQWTTWDFTANRVLTVAIQDLTAGTPVVVVDVSALPYYLRFGPGGAGPLPTDFRFFTGGGGGTSPGGNITAWDNVRVAVGPCDFPLLACRADVTNDTLVNVNDLLVVINTWGQNNPTGPRPQGDCDPAPSGDCLVNVNDLLTVINAWGACAVEQRACCFANGTCQVLGQVACTNAGGTWQSAGSTCTPNPCPPPPDNDNCADATLLTAVDSCGSGTLATATQDAAPICNGIAAGVGRWFKVVGTGGQLQATTCSSPFEFWDARLSVYCGTCTNLFCVVAANADTCGATHETVCWPSVSGREYFILVHAPSAPQSPDGSFTVCVTSTTGCTTPVPQCGLANDECNGAFTVNTGLNTGLSNVGATDGTQGPECLAPDTFEKDAWYKWTATFTGSAQFSSCGGVPVLDGALAVYSGPCTALVLLGCNDDGCAAFANFSIVVAAVTTGQQYYIRLGMWCCPTTGGQYSSTMQLNITPVSCTAWACPAGSVQEGEPCATAGPDTINGGCNSTPTVYGAITASGPAVCGKASTFDPASRDTDWYRFTVVAAGTYHVRASVSHPPAAFPGVRVGIVSGIQAPGTPCIGGVVTGSDLTVPSINCVWDAGTVTLQPGDYAVIVLWNAFTGSPCTPGPNDYWVQLITP